jgi:hypothetical protein
MSIASGDRQEPAPTSGLDPDALMVINQINYLLDLAHERAVAISIPDSSLEIAERIVVQNTLLTVVGIYDSAVGHYRTRWSTRESAFCQSGNTRN